MDRPYYTLKVITTSKLTNSIAFDLAIIWGLRAECRRPTVEQYKHPLRKGVLTTYSKFTFTSYIATLLKSYFGMDVFFVNLLHTFRTPFLKNTSRWLLLCMCIKALCKMFHLITKKLMLIPLIGKD